MTVLYTYISKSPLKRNKLKTLLNQFVACYSNLYNPIFSVSLIKRSIRAALSAKAGAIRYFDKNS